MDLITLDMSEHLQKVRDKRWDKICSVEGEITVSNKGISNESLLQAAEGPPQVLTFSGERNQT